MKMMTIAIHLHILLIIINIITVVQFWSSWTGTLQRLTEAIWSLDPPKRLINFESVAYKLHDHVHPSYQFQS